MMRPPGGSNVGRLQARSRTRCAGIRFEWVERTCGPQLRVVATWKDRNGVPHRTAYSVHTNGLEGALDKAIAARTSNGAPQPDRADLLERLRTEFETRRCSPAPTMSSTSSTAGAMTAIWPAS